MLNTYIVLRAKKTVDFLPEVHAKRANPSYYYTSDIPGSAFFLEWGSLS